MNLALFVEQNQVLCLWLDANQFSCYVSSTYGITNFQRVSPDIQCRSWAASYTLRMCPVFPS
jgi:hypothetical protein